MEPNADAGEIRHFAELAAEWWDLRGPMATLHDINPTRIAYLNSRVGKLAGQRVLDVGCGGGILSEALADAGAHVTGIDLAGDSIRVAQQHAADHRLQIEYLEQSAEALAGVRAGSFDLVCCMELLEHVPDPAAIVAACAALTRTDGHVVFSTINRTLLARALMISAAEGLLRLVPRGTHDYGKFIRPSELAEWARAAGLATLDVQGMRYNPLLHKARLVGREVGVNYLMHCRPAA